MYLKVKFIFILNSEEVRLSIEHSLKIEYRKPFGQTQKKGSIMMKKVKSITGP